MFRRKEEHEQQKPAGYNESGLSSYTRNAAVQPASEVVQAAEEQEGAVLVSKPAKSPFETVRQFPDKVFKPTDVVRKAEEFRTVTPRATSEKSDKVSKRVMTVGQDSFLKGEISTCDRVIVEGQVDAKMTDVIALEVTETGAFKGSAVVEEAEISGIFEGDIAVKGRLMIYSTGKVTGKIRYGEIEVQRGGKLSGEIKSSEEAELPARSSRSANRVTHSRSESTEAAADKGEYSASSSISELFAAN